MKTFSMGDRVRIIGPSNVSSRGAVNHIFTISEMQKPDDEILYSEKCYGWYPASSLELVEPGLQIGDWVEVVGPDIFGTFNRGEFFQIDGEWLEERRFSGQGYHWHNRVCLRKLTNDEIAERLNQKPNFVKFDCNVSEFSQKLEESHDKAVQVSELDKIRGELKIMRLEQRAIKRRLDFVEKFQKDQSERKWSAGP